MVTVVDSEAFFDIYQSEDEVGSRPDLADGDGIVEGTALRRKIVDLVAEQIEVADYVLLNKADQVDAPGMASLASLASSLNPRASVLPCKFGDVDLAVVLGSTRGEWAAEMHDEADLRLLLALSSRGRAPRPAASGSRARAAAGAKMEPTFQSFVYSRRRPFSSARLSRAINQLPIARRESDLLSSSSDNHASEARAEPDARFGGAVPETRIEGGGGQEASPLQNVVRSKGFVWTERFHKVALLWSQAGKAFSLREFGMFWAATPLKYWPRAPHELAELTADFSPNVEGIDWGDRRQEIVMIGCEMDREGISRVLDGCLLSDAEMQEYQEAAHSQPDLVRMDFSQSPPRPRRVTG